MSVKRMLRPAVTADVERVSWKRCITCVDVRDCWVSAQVDVTVHWFPELDFAFVGFDNPETIWWRRACAVRERKAEGKDGEGNSETVRHCAEPSALTRGCSQSFFGSRQKTRSPSKRVTRCDGACL